MLPSAIKIKKTVTTNLSIHLIDRKQSLKSRKEDLEFLTSHLLVRIRNILLLSGFLFALILEDLEEGESWPGKVALEAIPSPNTSASTSPLGLGIFLSRFLPRLTSQAPNAGHDPKLGEGIGLRLKHCPGRLTLNSCPSQRSSRFRAVTRPRFIHRRRC